MDLTFLNSRKSGNIASPFTVSHSFIHLSTRTTVSDFLSHFSLLLSIQHSVHIQCIWGEFGSVMSSWYHFGLLKSSTRQFQVVLNRSPMGSEKLPVNNCLLKHRHGQVQDQEGEAGQPQTLSVDCSYVVGVWSWSIPSMCWSMCRRPSDSGDQCCMQLATHSSFVKSIF